MILIKRTILILGDQLSRNISALEGADKNNDIVLFIEAKEESNHVRHHQQKIVLVLAAMRHFAESLHEEGFNVDYLKLDTPDNSGSLSQELALAVNHHQSDLLVVTEPSEYRMSEYLHKWQVELGIPVEIKDDNRFLCSKNNFAEWSKGRKTLRMEHFYRYIRRKTGLLMDGDKPEGDRWNYDSQNRRTIPAGIKFPKKLNFVPDKITLNVISTVKKTFGNHFGKTDNFNWAVTRRDALNEFNHFIQTGLPTFGDFQDAMHSGEAYLFHSAISPYLNLGLLNPDEVCKSVVQVYKQGLAPLNCTEGFLRQVLGWREYVRGIYWLKMPGYKNSNFFDAQRPLPEFYWTGKTNMNCLKEVISQTCHHAYAHHIQRLMITGNFSLLAGIKPSEVEEWYLIVFADAFEWVELPNTHGMALYADGGLLASKPYAASAAYINRMSDYCRHCHYKHASKTGKDACPFNYLYWNFLMANEDKLRSNPRMGLPYKMLDRMLSEQQILIRNEAESFLNSLSTTAY